MLGYVIQKRTTSDKDVGADEERFRQRTLTVIDCGKNNVTKL